MSEVEPPATETYDRTIRGVFGRFGAGMGIRVCFIQAGIEAHDLDNIALVHEIPGSDRWPVRDLFQREVDHDRITHGLLPWLQDESKVKFFNPLTLTLLPFDADTGDIVSSIPALESGELSLRNGQCWATLSRPPYYRFCWLRNGNEDHFEYARVDWSSRHVQLVAIDGQHRVSALKRFMRDRGGPGHESLLHWTIPVVLTGLEQDPATEPTPATILGVIRNMFVYINTQARIPTKARQILLNDEHISYLCTQEMLQYAHENDIEPDASSHEPGRVPLLFFDWRGETKDCVDTRSPAAMKSIVEISEWMEHYFLGQQIDEESADAFGVLDSSDPLWTAFESHRIGPREARLVRSRFRDHVLPGIAHLLQSFAPYEEYIEKVRVLERRWNADSDLSRHALSRLRFGSHGGADANTKEIDGVYRELVEELIDLKMEIPHLLNHDVGMRGIAYAFGVLRSWYLHWDNSDISQPWLVFSEWFVRQLNRAYQDGWFGGGGSQHRRFITTNVNDNIVNYRIEDAKKALGALVVILISAYARSAGELVDDENFAEVWEDFADGALAGTLRTGYKSYHRGRLATENPSWSKQRLKSEVEACANKGVHNHLRRLRRAVESVTAQSV